MVEPLHFLFVRRSRSIVLIVAIGLHAFLREPGFSLKKMLHQSWLNIDIYLQSHSLALKEEWGF